MFCLLGSILSICSAFRSSCREPVSVTNLLPLYSPNSIFLPALCNYLVLFLFSLCQPALELCQQRMEERHGRMKGFYFLTLVHSQWNAPGAPSSQQILLPAPLRSFVAECLQWDTIQWTALLSTLQGRYLASSRELLSSLFHWYQGNSSVPSPTGLPLRGGPCRVVFPCML